MKKLLALAILATAAHGGQVCHTATHASSPTNWSQPFVLPKHDPALGALQSITVTLRCELTGQVRAENPSPAAAVYTTRLSFLGTVRRPDGSAIHVLEPNVGSHIPFAAWDGQIDFAGPSGITLPNLSASRASHVELSSPADLALFTAASNGEQITLPVEAFGTSSATGPGPLVTQFDTNAMVEVTVCYGYREVRQSTAIPSQPTTWQQSPVFAKHDPAIGPLRAVRIRARADLTGSARHESWSTGPSTAFVQFASSTSILRPDTSVALLVYAVQVFVDPVTAFDGITDLDGTSGATHNGIQVEASAEATLSSPSDLALFTAGSPGETIALGVVAQDVSVAAGTVITLFTTAVAVDLELRYDYSAPIVPFCFGDGSGAACPCGNASAVGAQQGCLDSFGLGGELRGAGFAEIGADTLVLTASNLPLNTSVLFFQGTSALSVAFGDGLRCAGGAIRRLGVRAASGGAASCPPPGATISTLGQATVGATLRYQAWYRNSAAFCTASTFNLTNGLAIAW